METRVLSVREMKKEEIPMVVDYWCGAEPTYLKSLGVDLDRMPSPEDLQRMLHDQLGKSYEKKPAYCITWLVDGVPSGHSNINRIAFGEEASMHLHLWHGHARRRGLGSKLIQLTLPFYFDNFALNRLVCEPFALNPAPEKALQQSGFVFEKEYTTIPGTINFMQPVKRYILTRSAFERSRSLAGITE